MISLLRCNTARTRFCAHRAIIHTKNPTLVTKKLVDHVRFTGLDDEFLVLTDLFETHRVRSHVYAAQFGVRIKPKQPFPRCHTHIILNPRLSLGVYTDCSQPMVVQMCKSPDEIEHLVAFIDSLNK